MYRENIMEEYEERTDKNLSVLVTGASRGIGRAVAEAFASRGYRVYMAGNRHGDELKSDAMHFSDEYNAVCVPLVFDVSDPAQVKRAFEGIPSLDIVINCAGIAHFDLLQETDEEDWGRVIGTNLSGAFLIIKNAIPLLLKSENARVINISSVWGTRGAAMESAYSASKGGLDALTRSAALELAPAGIPVNAIACGVIDTEMNRAHLDEEELEALRNEIPAGRFGTVREVAKLVMLLIKAPSYLTGQVIAFSGGWQV